MQKRDQPRAALVLGAEFRCDPSADLTCRARRRRSYPSDELGLLLVVQRAGAAAGLKTHERLMAAFGKRAMPPTHRIVVEKQHLGDLLTSSFPRRAKPKRWPAEPSDSSPNHHAPAQSAPSVPPVTKSRRESCPQPNPIPSNWQALFAFSMSRGIARESADPDRTSRANPCAVAGAPRRGRGTSKPRRMGPRSRPRQIRSLRSFDPIHARSTTTVGVKPLLLPRQGRGNSRDIRVPPNGA